MVWLCQKIASVFIQSLESCKHFLWIRAHYIFCSWEVACRPVPDIMADDLISSEKVGIRYQWVNLRTQTLEMDFVIETTPSSLHILNAIPPAFASSFAFTELPVDRHLAVHH